MPARQYRISMRASWHNGGLPSGSNFAAVEPDLGITWMHKGWNVSAALHAAIPVSASTAPGYRYWSGSEFAADYTITKTLGKWTLGVGGHQINQYEDDRFNGEVVPDHRSQLYVWAPLPGFRPGHSISRPCGTARFRPAMRLPVTWSSVRRQNIRHNSRRKLAECGPRLGFDVRRRACGVASADARWSVV
jgi:hypothetical protein